MAVAHCTAGSGCDGKQRPTGEKKGQEVGVLSVVQRYCASQLTRYDAPGDVQYQYQYLHCT